MLRLVFKAFLVNMISLSMLFCQELTRPDHSALLNLRYFRIDHGVAGARANSLGRAFIGVADDATAATINPAGLTVLTRPETSAHIRIRRSVMTELAGSQSNWREKKAYSHFDNDFLYGAIVYPIKKFTIATYWDVIMAASSAFEYQQVVAPGLTRPLKLDEMLQYQGTCPGRKVHHDFQVVNIGIAAAYPMSSYPISIGFSFKLTKLSFSLMEIHYFSALLLQENDHPVTDLSNSADNVYAIRTIDDNDWDFSYTLGLLYKPFAKFSLGLVYNKYPNMDIKSEIFYPAYSVNDAITLTPKLEAEKIHLKLPDSYGIGLCYRLTNWLRIAADILQIHYSDILKKNLSNFPGLKIDDVIEYHGGLEYLGFLRNFDFALRAGIYVDPFHLPYTVCDNPAVKTLFPEENDIIYYTIGGGFGIRKLKIELCLKLASELIESEIIASLGIRL